MNPMIVTNATGAKTMPIGMTVAAPESQMTGSELTDFAADAEVNSGFLANLLSAFTAHERCGVHLYRTVAGMTQFRNGARSTRSFWSRPKTTCASCRN